MEVLRRKEIKKSKVIPLIKMKSYCLKDHNTGHVFKVLLTKEELDTYLNENPDMKECIDCVECDDAPSITLE